MLSKCWRPTFRGTKGECPGRRRVPGSKSSVLRSSITHLDSRDLPRWSLGGSLKLLAWPAVGVVACQEEIRQIARSVTALDTEIPERGSPLLWKRTPNRPLGGNLWWAEGWSLTCVPMRGRRSAIGLLPRRLYFDSETGGAPLRAREFEILGPRPRPRGLAPARLLEEGRALLLELSGGREALSLERLDPELSRGVVIRIGEQELPVRDRLAGYHEKHGVDSSPGSAWVALIPEDGIPREVEERFEGALRTACARRGLQGRIEVLRRRVDVVERRLREYEQTASGKPLWTSGVVWFLLRSKSERPPESFLELFRRLDRAGVAWRRAYAGDPWRYSVRDQVGSLLQAVGGTLHRVGLAGGRELPWSLGVDVSHPLDGESSNLCLTLVDPSGRLAGFWRCEQPRDETARTASLGPLLRDAGRRLADLGGAEIVLAIRDGRLFENEKPLLYQSELGARVELLELAKNNVPPLFEEGHGGSAHVPIGAVAGRHPDSEWVYLLPGVTQEVGGLEAALKFRRCLGGACGAFDDRALAEILVALTYAPGLGSRRSRFPAPIYWADGIAGASGSDLRFRGQQVRPRGGA